MSLQKQHDSKSDSERKRPESPVPAFTSYDHTDHDAEYQNERGKKERAASPTSSCLSLMSSLSMDPPANIREGKELPFDSRVKLERPASPTTSYLSLKTDWSMDLPTNFKDREVFHWDTRIEGKSETSASSNPFDTCHFLRGDTCLHRGGSERAHSPTLSSVSELADQLVEPSTSSKAEASFPFDPRLLTENHLKCPVCRSTLKDPVSIPCGHNYCRNCINTFWDSCAEEYVCPECGRGSKTRPDLNTNTALAQVVKNLQQAGFSPALPPLSYAGPDDVACEYCTDQKLKAVKSCLTCDVLYCETHIKDHYTIPALQKHKLSDVAEAKKNRLSQQHLPTDKEEEDNSMSESVPNTSMVENEAAGISTTMRKINKDELKLENMYDELWQDCDNFDNYDDDHYMLSYVDSFEDDGLDYGNLDDIDYMYM